MKLHLDPPLFGTTPIERALIEMWNRRMELELLNALRRDLPAINEL